MSVSWRERSWIREAEACSADSRERIRSASAWEPGRGGDEGRGMDAADSGAAAYPLWRRSRASALAESSRLPSAIDDNWSCNA